MSSNKRRKLENEGQSGSSGQCIGVEMDSLKQRNKKLESNNQILKLQIQLLRAHVSSDTLLLLHQKTKEWTNGVTIDMSLSNVQSVEDNPRRDSFETRFIGDDLTEVILQFLPIKHKFYFECVSKQFQRTVYKKQYELIIKDSMRENLKRFETIVEKLPNIMSLKDETDIYLNNEEIEVIIKNCNHLIECDIDLSSNSTEIRKSFADRFGPQLTSISLFDIKYKLNINLMVNIEEINIYFNVQHSKDLIDFYTKFKPKNVKKLSLSFEYLYPLNLEQISDIQRKYFEPFIDNNKSITHLSLIFDGDIDEPFDISLGCISQLNQLISLQLVYNIKSESFETFESFKSDLKQIAVNCRKLKSLSLTFEYITENWVESDFMSEIKKFKELKRFEINIKTYWNDSDKFEEYFINSLETGFEGLTHLTIDCDLILNKHFLDNFDINLPKLQNLIIRSPMKATEWTADDVSLLSNLEVLSLNIKHKKKENKYLIVLLETKILENCRKIKSLELNRFNP